MAVNTYAAWCSFGFTGKGTLDQSPFLNSSICGQTSSPCTCPRLVGLPPTGGGSPIPAQAGLRPGSRYAVPVSTGWATKEMGLWHLPLTVTVRGAFSVGSLITATPLGSATA